MGPTSLSWYLEGTGDLYLHLKIKGKEENLGAPERSEQTRIPSIQTNKSIRQKESWKDNPAPAQREY